MPRLLKQLIYGLFYLLVLILVAVGIYYFYLIPEPTCFDGIKNQDEIGIDCGGRCSDCELKNLALQIDKPLKFGAGKSKSTFLVKITNPSARYGLRNFEYELQVFDLLGFVRQKFYGQSSILPRESKYLIFPAVSIDYRDIKEITFKVLTSHWTADLNDSLGIKFKNVTTVPLSRSVQVTGYLVNDSASSFNSVFVGGVIFSRKGEIINASSTKLDKVSAFSENSFVIFFPDLENVADIDLKATKIFYEIR